MTDPISRREFLGMGATYSVGMALAPEAVAAIQNLATNPANKLEYLRPLAPGAVHPDGWLRQYLQKQAQELGRHLPEVSWPFGGAYWSGEENPPAENAWWPWEQKAYWIDGAVRCGIVLQDQDLIDSARRAIDYTLAHPAADGYLGPEFAHHARNPDVSRDNSRWPHNIFFRALTATGDAYEDPKIAEAMRRHFLADQVRFPYGSPSRNVTNIEGMLWVYQRTGDETLLKMATHAREGFLSSVPPGNRESGDLHPSRVLANTPIHAHGVTYIEKAKLPAILYMHTGDASYLRYALAAQERIFSHHMLVDGIPSTSEDYGDTTATNTHETCDIVDHMWSWGYLLMATGESTWGDRIERACFNAGMGALKKDWKALQYFSSPNQCVATSESPVPNLARHPELADIFKGWVSYRPNPGHESACCGANVHRMLPNYVIRMWMKDWEGGLVSTLYGANTVKTTVGPHQAAIEIHQDTQYPFEEEIRLSFKMAEPVAFPLSLRIPQWCQAPQLKLNGKPFPLPRIVKGFVRLNRTFEPGDLMSLTLPMTAKLSFWPCRGVGIEHGPLVYALDIAATWSSHPTPGWSSEQYPEWNAKPASDWNYGIGVAETTLLDEVQLTRSAPSADPWMNPPVNLSVPLRRIPGRTLQSDPHASQGLETPSLPLKIAGSFADEAVERISLAPYGATHLRLAIFPSYLMD